MLLLCGNLLQDWWVFEHFKLLCRLVESGNLCEGLFICVFVVKSLWEFDFEQVVKLANADSENNGMRHCHHDHELLVLGEEYLLDLWLFVFTLGRGV